jgi:integrase/recombinase XerD
MSREGKAKVLTTEEFKRLLLVASHGQFKDRNIAMLYCSFGLGLRAKEMASLTVGDLVGNNNHLLDELNLTSSMTKGDKQRHIYLSNKKVRAALLSHIKNLSNPQPEQPFFKTQRKSKFNANTMQKWFKSMYKKAGIVGSSSHSGRRTFITS